MKRGANMNIFRPILRTLFTIGYAYFNFMLVFSLGVLGSIIILSIFDFIGESTKSQRVLWPSTGLLALVILFPPWLDNKGSHIGYRFLFLPPPDSVNVNVGLMLRQIVMFTFIMGIVYYIYV